MDTTDFEKEIDKAMESKGLGAEKPIDSTMRLSQPIHPPKMPVFKSESAKQAPSLTDQWAMHQNIGRELRDRLRREKQKLLNDHDTEWLALRHRYEQRISDTIATMRAELEAEQRRMVEAYQVRTRELDLLAQRVEDDG